MITNEMLSRFSADFNADKCHRIAMNAVTQNGVTKSAVSQAALREDVHQFSINLKQGEITNQKSSGRCWMFAALNTMRFAIIKKLNLETYELSQNYPLFWDKLEKSNYFLENILATLDEPTGGRLIAWLLSAPLGDGGQWDMFCALVDKYGVVPKDAMPETECSSNTREMDKFLTLKLREYACKLRAMHAEGKSAQELAGEKEAMLSTIYRMLCICLGEPPKTVTLEVRDKDDKFIRDAGITPQEFFKKYVGWDLNKYVSLINAPTADKPYGRTFTVRFLGSVHEGRPVKYLNLPIESLKRAAIAQLKDGQPVWFGSDVGQWLVRQGGLMDMNVLELEQLFDTDFPMDKAQRLDYGESLMTHAMVLMGVNLDEDGKPTRWRVENSWGKDAGKDGYYIMSDKWFDEFTYQVVVDEKYLTDEERAQFKQEPIVLEPWDPMGSLAL
ncbi:MAG TPA: C1 family peptidase [Candidatus Fimadaptatus faecigallinarum]|uniref:Aminopeptidase n=1 Tax=Candidatus Fimadaptatus faecigallinarum TaxID=2840814 RepID=A0A9D1LRX3_9FIRM|nr:C1 family peptidase [Candidatus Fimadaptatus faecigallinarum]